MRLSVRQWGTVMFVLFAAHNAEEAIGFVHANENWLALLDALQMRRFSMAPDAFLRSLGVVTVASAPIAAWIALTRETRATRVAVRIWAAILVANVFVPHVPAAIAAGGYVPGVITAVLLNLPIGLACLRDTAAPRGHGQSNS